MPLTLAQVKEKLPLYKPNQGMIVRVSALGVLGAFAVFAAYALYQWPSNESWWRSPLIGDIVWGLPFSALFFLALFGGVYFMAFNHPKAADFLIETEAELRKVNWPARHEYLGSSFVVVVSVVVLGGFLFLADTVVSHLMRLIGYL
ncbi:MAG: preprotein translocase subunit SecE [Planctomycetes bacterium]|nr:preprotein translocase subunit SecE [Planctomycetota bacterium]